MKFYGNEVTEASDVAYNNGKRLDVSKFKQFDRGLNGNTLPTQMFLDKLARNNAWSITIAMFDSKLTACFEIAVNANSTTNQYLTYEQICKQCGWKSFKLSENGQTVIYKKAA